MLKTATVFDFDRKSGFQIRVRVTAYDGSWHEQSLGISVTRIDDEPPPIMLSVSATEVNEDTGTGRLKLDIRRSDASPFAPSLTIALFSSDSTKVTVPGTAVIPAGQSSVSVPIEVVDNDKLDGRQVINLFATVDHQLFASVDVTVNDVEVLTVSTPKTTLREGSNSKTISVSRSNSDRSKPVLVRISGFDQNRIGIPSTIIIEAGQQSKEIEVLALENGAVEGHQWQQLHFESEGYFSSELTLLVEDNEPSPFHHQSMPYDVDGDAVVQPIDALLVINCLNRRASPFLTSQETLQFLAMVDVNNDFLVTPLDALMIINRLNEPRIESEAERSAVLPIVLISGDLWKPDDDDAEVLRARDLCFLEWDV